MNYIIGVAAVACCFFLTRSTLNLETIRGSQYFRPRCAEEQVEGRQLTAQQIRAWSLLLTLLAAVAAARLVWVVHDPINLLKLCIALVVLTGCACVDALDHRIPNVLSGLLALAALVLLMAGFLTGQEGAFSYLNSSVFAAVLCTVCLTLGSVLSHQGIGIGDIKLVAALALMGGVTIVGGTLFFAMIMCALAAAYLLLTKKKTMRETVPFGPFLLAGYILSLFVLNF